MNGSEQAQAQRCSRAAGTSSAPRQGGDDRLRRVAELLVPGLAGWCAIDLVASTATSPARRHCRSRSRSRRTRPHGPAIVMRTGEPELVRRITEDMLFAAARGDAARAGRAARARAALG